MAKTPSGQITSCNMAIIANAPYAQEETTFVRVNNPVPDFEFERSPGTTQHLSELKGKTVLITFFATWCGTCLKELPHIQS